jgi:hypothetical protein
MAFEEESLRGHIALGWVINLLLVTISLLFNTIDSILMDDSFRSLRVDPGTSGLTTLTYILALYALMPIYVHLVHGLRIRLFRWLAVAMAGLGFVYFLLHHLAHWRVGQRPDLTSSVFDLALHAVALWVIVNSIKWAKFPRTGTE